MSPLDIPCDDHITIIVLSILTRHIPRMVNIFTIPLAQDSRMSFHTGSRMPIMHYNDITWAAWLIKSPATVCLFAQQLDPDNGMVNIKVNRVNMRTDFPCHEAVTSNDWNDVYNRSTHFAQCQITRKHSVYCMNGCLYTDGHKNVLSGNHSNFNCSTVIGFLPA